MNKTTLLVAFALLVTALASPSYATDQFSVRTFPLRIASHVFTNPLDGCVQRDDCDLVGARFQVQDYEVYDDDDENNKQAVLVFGTGFLAGIETTHVAALRKYSIVQFIRGCMWNSWIDGAGNLQTAFRIIRSGGHLGTRTLMVHREWTVDTNDDVPAYHADKSTGDQHYLMQWSNPPPAWIPDRQQNLLGERQPTVPFGFITDYPGPGVVRPEQTVVRVDGSTVRIPQEAQNSSLEFKTCVYKTTDVPATTTGSPDEFQKPIVCYQWHQSFVYNHTTSEMEMPPTLHSQCSRPFTEQEQHVQTLLQETPAR
jgi:hypothetical protein